MARASLHEVEGILELVKLLGYVSAEDLARLKAARDNCARLVYGLLRRMTQRAASG